MQNIKKPNENNTFFAIFHNVGPNLTQVLPLRFQLLWIFLLQFWKKSLKLLKIALLVPYLGKIRSSMGHSQNQVHNIFAEITKQDHFISSKYHKFWLSYAWFSTSGDVLLPKRAISNWNSYDIHVATYFKFGAIKAISLFHSTMYHFQQKAQLLITSVWSE